MIRPDRDHPFPGRTTADTDRFAAGFRDESGDLLAVRAPSGNALSGSGGQEPTAPALTPRVPLTLIGPVKATLRAALSAGIDGPCRSGLVANGPFGAFASSKSVVRKAERGSSSVVARRRGGFEYRSSKTTGGCAAPVDLEHGLRALANVTLQRHPERHPPWSWH